MKLKEFLGENINTQYRKQYNETKKLVNKWKKTGLLEDLPTEYDQHQIAILLENQARQLIDEISRTGSTGVNSEEWSGVALPLVRRIFTEIAAKDFVSVQAMNLPSGLVFFLDFKYATSQPGFTTADSTGNTIQQNTVYGITNQSGNPSEGLYGAGRFGYSINDQNSASLSPVTVSSASWADVAYVSSLSASIVNGDLKKVTYTLAGDQDVNGVRAFKASGSGFQTYYPAYTVAADNTGASSTTKVTFIVSRSAVDDDIEPGVSTVWYQKQTSVDYSRGDFEDTAGTSLAETIEIPELNVYLRSEPIIAKTRKLKAVWTPEFAQDLNAYHSIDAEAELTSILSEYISMEIDLEILDMLIQNAITVEYWSARIGEVHDGTTDDGEGDWILQASQVATGTSLAYQQGTWFQTLGTKIQKVSNKIHAKTMRGGANFIVVSPDIATVIESIPGYAADTDGTAIGTTSFAMGVQKTGALNNRFNVYKNPYMLENTLLMGFRGTQFLETGAVYAPYVPLIMTPLIYDPTNLTPRKGVMTRYAKKMVRPEFFGKIFVKALNTI